jgi:hypothetical protein
MKVIGDLPLHVVGHDAQKAPFHPANAVYILMVEKVELDPPVMETPNLGDSVKTCYQL